MNINTLVDKVITLYSQLLPRGIQEQRQLWFLHSDRILPPDEQPLHEQMTDIINGISKSNSHISPQNILVELLYGVIYSSLYQFHEPASIRGAVAEVINHLLSYKATREVDIPLVNLRVGSTPVNFGLITIHQIIDADKNDSWWNHIEKHVGSDASFIVGSYARIETPGDPYISIEFAGKQTDEMLLFIRAIGFPISTQPQLQIGALNDYPVWQNRPYRLHTPSQNIRLGYESQMVVSMGPGIAPYNLRKDLLSDIEDSQLEKLHQLIKSDFKAPGTEIKGKLFTGLRWLGQATKPDTSSGTFTKLCFALEALIGGEASEPYLTTRGITATLAERAAFIVGQNSDERQEIHNAIGKYYKLRSAIVHGSEKKAIAEEEIKDFSSLVRRIAWATLNKVDEFPTIDSLQKWVLQQRYRDADNKPPSS